jgi:ATP-dependent RNA helicase DDX3X
LLPVVAALDKVLPKPVSESSIDPSVSDVSLNTTVEDGSPIENVRVSIDQRGALPRCIILAPTRELASQIHVDARRLIFNSNLKAVCVYGGNDLRVQLSELSTGCDIIVATPGRLSDLVERGVVSLGEVGYLILDEADRMLDMGFEVYFLSSCL